MQSLEQLKAEITEIEECLKNSNNEDKKTSFENRINNYLEKVLKEKKKQLLDRQN